MPVVKYRSNLIHCATVKLAVNSYAFVTLPDDRVPH